MESIHSVLKNYFKKSGLEQPIEQYQTLQEWPSLVGKTIAQVTEPQQIKDGKLFVKVQSDAWRNELIFYKQDMLIKINEKMGSKTINEIILL